MTINDFRGQVRISDIQAAFDEIVSRINSMIGIYNTSETLADDDYTKGSPVLSSAGYTLTIGGLKSLLGSYDGTLLGCRVYKLSDNSVYVSRGIYIKDGQIINIPGGVAEGSEDSNLKDLYYRFGTQEILFATRVESAEISWISPTLISNISWGNVTASNNSGTAWQIAAGEDKEWTMFSGNYTERRKGRITWNFPEEVTISQVTFNLKINSNNSVLRVLAGDTEILNKSYEGENELEENISINTDDLACRKLTLELSSDEGGITSSTFSDLVINGKRNEYTLIVEAVPYYEWDMRYVTISSQLTEENDYYYGFTSSSYIGTTVSSYSSDNYNAEIQVGLITPDEENWTNPGLFTGYRGFKANLYNDRVMIDTGDSEHHQYTHNFNFEVNKEYLYRLKFDKNTLVFTSTILNANNSILSEQTFNYTGSMAGDENILLKMRLTQLGRNINYHWGGGISLRQSYQKNNDALVGGISIIQPEPVVVSDIIKITNLNWKSENLIINNIEGVQLEHPGMSITNQNRSVDVYGGNWENVDTSNGPKFVVYTTNVVTNDPSDISQVDFQGINILGSYRSNAQYRRHWLTQILSLIFIPYKFIISDRRVKKGGRYSYNVNLNNSDYYIE